MKLRQLPAALFMLFVFSVPALSADWQVYKNHEHGFSVDYPLDLFARIEPAEGGDGTTFRSADGDIVLSLYGFNNGDELPMKTVRDIIVENYGDRDITYERLTDRWMVLSGYESDQGARSIFYHRLATNASGDRYSVLELTYPESKRELVDKLIKRMSRSLTSPK